MNRMSEHEIARMISDIAGCGLGETLGYGITKSDAIKLATAFQTKRVADALEKIAESMAIVDVCEQMPMPDWSIPATAPANEDDVAALVAQMIKGHRLCYIDDGKAYFTNIPIGQQRGDDWDDAPYEHNAGPPYCKEPGQIVFMGYRCEKLMTPAQLHTGHSSPYSVDSINRGAACWLSDATQDEGILAGMTPANFIAFVEKFGGTVGAPMMMPSR